MIIRGATTEGLISGAEDAVSHGVDMEKAQGLPSDQSSLAGEVNESLGLDDQLGEDSGESQPRKDEDLPLAAKERLGRQEKRHKKELRAMQERLNQLQAHVSSIQPTQNMNQSMNPYTNTPMEQGGEDERIHRAVTMALHAKDEQERKAKETEQMMHVHKQYEALQDHLDNASDEHDDFDDIVKSPDAPFTSSMRDTAMLLHKAGVVKASDLLYKLGKNPEELKKISQLHPLDQAAEMMRLGFALTNNGGDKASSQPRPLGQIKTNPVISKNSVSEQTPVSELRKRMKASDWK